MVAYSFKPSFLEPIRLREKRQTIRLPRKRHARPGEELQLFTGPRMRPTRLGAAQCVAAREVRLDFAENTVTIDDAVVIAGEQALDAFAVRDGFRPPDHLSSKISPWSYMTLWWRQTHPGHAVFLGVLIDWDDTFAPLVALERAA